MTEEQASVLLYDIDIAVDYDGPWMPIMRGLVRELYKRGYKIESYLTGEDYEKQQARDFPRNLPGDTKENSGGN
jgi:hypothetical protein